MRPPRLRNRTPLRPMPLAGWSRCATGISSIAAGLIHISAAADHQNLPVMMSGFLVVAGTAGRASACGCCSGAGLDKLPADRRPSALMLGSVGMWLMSRTAGSRSCPAATWSRSGSRTRSRCCSRSPPSRGCSLLMSPRARPRCASPRPAWAPRASAFLAAGAFTLFVPALMLGGGGHHCAGQAGHPHARRRALPRRRGGRGPDAHGRRGSGDSHGGASGASDDTRMRQGRERRRDVGARRRRTLTRGKRRRQRTARAGRRRAAVGRSPRRLGWFGHGTFRGRPRWL